MKKLDLSLSNLITKAARVVTREYQKECAPFGVTPSQAGIVYILSRVGSSSQVEIAKLLHLEKTNVNAMVKKLAASGFVEIQKVPDDARKTMVVLTAKGIELSENLIEVDKKVGDIYNTLAEDSNNLDVIRKYLEKIVFGE